MRSSLLALSLLAIPAALWADDLPVDSEVTSVTSSQSRKLLY